MKSFSIATLAVICAASTQVLGASVSFNVATTGAGCGSGTTISCSPSPSSPCKGNFSPAQGSVVVTHAAGNCHISLYNQKNQAGGVVQRLNTDTTGTCISVSPASWLSYGVFCD